MNKLFKVILAIAGVLYLVVIFITAFFGQDRSTPYVPDNSPVVNSNLGVNRSNDTEKTTTTNIEELESDKALIEEVWQITLTFINTTNQDLMEYISNDDSLNIIAYSQGIMNSDNDFKTISDNFSRIKGLMRTAEGKEILDNIESTYNNYISLIERFSAGNFSTETTSIITSVTQELETRNLEVIEFLTEQE